MGFSAEMKTTQTTQTDDVKSVRPIRGQMSHLDFVKTLIRNSRNASGCEQNIVVRHPPGQEKLNGL